jgi:hypothetical protein
MKDPLAMTSPELIAEVRRLRANPCPHVVTSAEGTSYCELAETRRRKEQPDTSYTIETAEQTIDIYPTDDQSYRNGAYISASGSDGSTWGGVVRPAAIAKLAMALQAAAEMAEDD